MFWKKKPSQAKILSDLFEKYRHPMFVIANSILHNAGQAEDAVSNAFEKVVPHLDQCRDTDSYKTKVFLTQIVKNCVQNYPIHIGKYCECDICWGCR